MEEKQAVLESLAVWIWLFKNPGKRKQYSPYWNYIEDYDGFCPLCEYDVRLYNKDKAPCDQCILYKKKICFNFPKDHNLAYWKWIDASKNHKPAAARITGTLRRYAKEKGWLTEGWEKNIFKGV
jgi:hypothetical protein